MKNYDRFAEEYIKLRNKKGFEPCRHIEIPAMLNSVGNIKNKKLLDLGCGFGEHAKFYSEKGAKITGLDNSKKEIEYARFRNIKGAKFIVHDISEDLPFENNKFDVITCSVVLSHLKDIDKFFRECYRVLRNKGIMLFTMANPLLYQEKRLVGRLKTSDGMKIFGDYFKRRVIKHKWGNNIEIGLYHRTLEDYISAFLKAGFNLVEFKEPVPIASSKKFDVLEYEFRARNPYLFLFKLEKK